MVKSVVDRVKAAAQQQIGRQSPRKNSRRASQRTRRLPVTDRFVAGATASTPNGGAGQSAGLDGAGADPKTCSALQQALELLANQLSSTEDEVLF
jgi:hypothetical protein